MYVFPKENKHNVTPKRIASAFKHGGVRIMLWGYLQKKYIAKEIMNKCKYW